MDKEIVGGGIENVGVSYYTCGMIYRIIFYLVIVIVVSMILYVIWEVIKRMPEDHPLVRIYNWVKRIFK